jgi:hypothetical protein
MSTVRENNIQDFSKDICPISGFQVIQRPEWTNVGFGRDYRLTVKVIGGRIILNQSSGHGTADDAKDALNLVKSIETEVIPEGLSYIHISDYSKLKGATLDTRKYYTDYMKNQEERLLGLIFFGVSPFFKISIKLGQRLSSIAKFKVKISRDYTEAINLALSMLSKDQDGSEFFPLEEVSPEYEAFD